MKTLLVFLLLASGQVWAEDELTQEASVSLADKADAWIFKVGANYANFETSLPTFNGLHHKVKGDDANDLFGVNLEVTKNLNLFSGFITALTIGGDFYQVNDRQNGLGTQDIDVELAQMRNTQTVTDIKASLSMGWNFRAWSLLVTPFVEGGVGFGESTTKRKYDFEGLDGTTQKADSYDVKLKESFNMSYYGVGVNFISSRGITTYIKATNYNYTTTKGKLEGSYTTGEGVTTDVSGSTQREFSNMAYTLGIGFAI